MLPHSRSLASLARAVAVSSLRWLVISRICSGGCFLCSPNNGMSRPRIVEICSRSTMVRAIYSPLELFHVAGYGT
eukprot:scaffold6570_cov51-Attheya_sp.AAC.8